MPPFFWLFAVSAHLLLVPLVAMAAFQSFIAIWAATSKQHWFWRALAVWAALALLVPIETWDPAWICALSSALIITVLLFLRLKKGRLRPSSEQEKPFPRMRFGLLDLFLLILLFGLALATLLPVVRHYRPSNYPGWLIGSTAMALLALLTFFSTLGSRQRLTAILLFIALPALAVAVVASGDINSSTGFVWPIPLGEIGEKLVTGALFVLLLRLTLRLTLAEPTAMTISRPRPFRRIAAASVLVLALLQLAFLYALLLQRAPRPAKFELANNHYNRIFAIVLRVQAINPKNFTRADLRTTSPNSETAQELDALYSELLPLLASPNAVDYDPAHDAHENDSSRIQAFRILARSLEAESKAAHFIANQPDSAADFALATLELGDTLTRGGVAVQALVGEGIKGAGLAQLIPLRGEVSSANRRQCIAILARCLTSTEPLADLQMRERHFEETAYGWLVRYENALVRFTGRPTPWEQLLLEARRRSGATMAMLQTELACSLLHDDQGRFPDRLEDLVPDYLPELPHDPYSGQPLRYTLKNGKPLIYSTGKDGQDNGGHFSNSKTYYSTSPGYDLDLETFTRP